MAKLYSDFKDFGHGIKIISEKHFVTVVNLDENGNEYAWSKDYFLTSEVFAFSGMTKLSTEQNHNNASHKYKSDEEKTLQVLMSSTKLHLESFNLLELGNLYDKPKEFDYAVKLEKFKINQEKLIESELKECNREAYIVPFNLGVKIGKKVKSEFVEMGKERYPHKVHGILP